MINPRPSAKMDRPFMGTGYDYHGVNLCNPPLPSARHPSPRLPSPHLPSRYHSPEQRPDTNWSKYSPELYPRGHVVLNTGPMPQGARLSGSSSGDTASPGRRRKPKNHYGQRNQNVGIDIALRDLYQEASASIGVYRGLVEGFEEETQALTWAKGSTLDDLWKNKVKNRCRSEHEASKFAGVTERIRCRQDAVKAAIDRAQRAVSTWGEKHEIEHHIRTAKKAIVYCDGMVYLAKRAADERLACRYLMQELEDVKSLLDRKRHPWIRKLAHFHRSPRDKSQADGACGRRRSWRRRRGRHNQK